MWGDAVIESCVLLKKSWGVQEMWRELVGTLNVEKYGMKMPSLAPAVVIVSAYRSIEFYICTRDLFSTKDV